MPALAAKISEASQKTRSSARIPALDWTKGALVLCMVVYHSINYSVYRPLAFTYLAFLPLSFIFIAGFLIGQVYANRYDLGSWKPYLRLFTRGLKLLAIFVVLNVLCSIYLEHDIVEGTLGFFDRAQIIFLSGNGRNGIFEVLVPIAYFLMLSPLLLWLRSKSRPAIAVVAGGVVILCVVLESNGYTSKNLTDVSAGLLGIACGLVPMASIDRFARRWLVILGTYAIYRVCSYEFGERCAIQMFGALSGVLLLYGCALHFNCHSAVARQVVMLGNYSLLGYLAQIPMIRVIVKVQGSKPEHWGRVIAIMIATMVLLLIFIQIVDAVRRRVAFIDKGYKLVFA